VVRGVQQGQLLSSLPVAPGAQASSAQFAAVPAARAA